MIILKNQKALKNNFLGLLIYSKSQKTHYSCFNTVNQIVIEVLIQNLALV